MMLVKHAENSSVPPKELMDAIAKLSEDAVKAGTMLRSGGLAPTAQSTRVRLSGGQIQVSDGPFTESKEVIGGYAQFELPSKEEALAGAVQFMELHRKHWPGWEGETEIRRIFGPEDFDEHMKQRMRTPQAS
jgi:hypothetical protein